ncbi:hypothetical protein GCM10027596_04410 [Nocardioides korecus]
MTTTSPRVPRTPRPHAARGLVALGAALLLTPVVAAAPASAAGGQHLRDRSGDAPAAIDVTRLDATWDTSTIDVIVRVRDLRSTGRLVIGSGLAGWGSNYVVTRTSRGTTKQVHTYSEVTDFGAGPCPGIRVSWSAARNVVSLRLPVSCMGHADTSDEIVVNGADRSRSGRRDRIGRVFYSPGARQS